MQISLRPPIDRMGRNSVASFRPVRPSAAEESANAADATKFKEMKSATDSPARWKCRKLVDCLLLFAPSLRPSVRLHVAACQGKRDAAPSSYSSTNSVRPLPPSPSFPPSPPPSLTTTTLRRCCCACQIVAVKQRTNKRNPENRFARSL